MEKTFDELKNKLGEKKAWASSYNAKRMQATFTIIAYNLSRLMSLQIETDHGIKDESSLKKRKKEWLG